jgi:hypothetical protein
MKQSKYLYEGINRKLLIFKFLIKIINHILIIILSFLSISILIIIVKKQKKNTVNLIRIQCKIDFQIILLITIICISIISIIIILHYCKLLLALEILVLISNYYH